MIPSESGFYWAYVGGSKRGHPVVVYVFHWDGRLVADLYPWIRAKTDDKSEVVELATSRIDDDRVEWLEYIPWPIAWRPSIMLEEFMGKANQ